MIVTKLLKKKMRRNYLFMDSIFIERLNDFTPDYRAFVEGDFAGEAAEHFGREVGFSSEQQIILENGIMLYLLVFINEDQLVTAIATECKVPTETAAIIVTGIKASLPPQFTQAHRTALRQIETTVENPEQMISDIAEVEAALESIPPLRTMAQDMNSARLDTVHRSEQPPLQKSSGVGNNASWGS